MYDKIRYGDELDDPWRRTNGRQQGNTERPTRRPLGGKPVAAVQPSVVADPQSAGNSKLDPGADDGGSATME